METLIGVCHFFSETGTEGGHWAFQDERFITPNTRYFSCKKCHKYWDAEEHPDGPPLEQEGNLVVSKIAPVNVLGEDIEMPPDCPPNQHQFELTTKNMWSYEGLHVLENGDQLTIYSPENKKDVVWSGVISLHQHPLFTENAFGCWIHTDQNGIDRETWATWFFEEYPAKLTKNSP